MESLSNGSHPLDAYAPLYVATDLFPVAFALGVVREVAKSRIVERVFVGAQDMVS